MKLIELTEDIYLNCGIWDNGSTRMLFIAIPGYFASTAWCKSDEAYNDISGQKFEAITANDGISWLLPRYEIRRLSEYDRLDVLLDAACDKFKEIFNKKFNIK